MGTNTSLLSPLGQNSLNIDDILTDLRTYLNANNSISDVNYAGSNISVLLQIMAFLEHSINSTVALNSNQTLLLLSDIRQNIIYKAQELSYNISRVQSSKINVTVSSTNIVDELDSLIIPAFSAFTCGDYTFYNTSALTFNNSTLTNTVSLTEGNYITSDIDTNLLIQPSTNTSTFLINYRNIENNNLYIKLRRATETEFSENFTIVNSLLDLRSDINTAYVELDAETEYVRIITSFAGQGIVIQAGDTIDVSFLLSNGSVANGLAECTLNDSFSTQLGQDVTLTTVANTVSSSGTDRESNESIKANAPIFYNSGNRTINRDDFSSLLELNSLVKTANAWGGETTIPVQLGHIFLTYEPQDENSLFLSNLEEVNLIRFLSDLHIPAVNLLIHKPNYIFQDYTIQFVGDVTNIIDRQDRIRTLLTSYYSDNISRFRTEFFQTKAVDVIADEFDLIPRASVKVAISNRLLLSSTTFEDFVIQGNRILYAIPNSTQRYYLTRNNERIDLPQDSQDLNTFLLNGWTKSLEADFDLDVTFSGTVNGKAITELAEDTIDIDGVTYPKKDIQLDSVTIGYYNIELQDLVITTDITSDLDIDEFITLTYSDDINVISSKNTLIQLGNVVYT